MYRPLLDEALPYKVHPKVECFFVGRRPERFGPFRMAEAALIFRSHQIKALTMYTPTIFVDQHETTWRCHHLAGGLCAENCTANTFRHVRDVGLYIGDEGILKSQHEVEHMDGLETYFCKADTRIEFLNHLVHELNLMLILSAGQRCQRGLPEAFQKSHRSQIVWWHILGRVDIRHDERA